MTFFDPTKTNIPFIQYRKILISISVVLIAASIALLATKGLNFGVDFTGGFLPPLTAAVRHTFFPFSSAIYPFPPLTGR